MGAVAGTGGRRTTGHWRPEVRRRLLALIAKRGNNKLAAQVCGIGRHTLGEWIAQGDQDNEAGLDTEFARFSTAVHALRFSEFEVAMDQLDALIRQGDSKALLRYLSVLDESWREGFSVQMTDAVPRDDVRKLILGMIEVIKLHVTDVRVLSAILDGIKAVIGVSEGSQAHRQAAGVLAVRARDGEG